MSENVAVRKCESGSDDGSKNSVAPIMLITLQQVIMVLKETRHPSNVAYVPCIDRILHCNKLCSETKNQGKSDKVGNGPGIGEVLLRWKPNRSSMKLYAAFLIKIIKALKKKSLFKTDNDNLEFFQWQEEEEMEGKKR